MKFIAWDPVKNEKLKRERDISFDDVIDGIFGEGLLIVLAHPNKKKYENQRLYIIEINGYVYVVPCVEDNEKVFLKTLYPSRKYTKKYLMKGDV